MPLLLLRLLLSTIGGGVGMKAIQGLLGAAGKQATKAGLGTLAQSAAGRAAGTGVGQAIGRGTSALAGALPQALGKHVPTTAAGALSGAGRSLRENAIGTLGGGLGGLAGWMAPDLLMNEPAAPFGANSLVPQQQDDGQLSELLALLQGDVDDGLNNNPDIETLLGQIRQPLRLV